MTFSALSPTEIWLDVPLTVRDQSWQQMQTLSSAQSRWTVYLNHLCLHTFLPWLQAEYAPQASVWTGGVDLPQLWRWVNGTVLNLGNKRLVLIPDKSIETHELVVPQEWIDIPALAGDYFLAVQIAPEGDWLRIWGYATHAQLKTQGQYDADDRTYTINALQMITDLDAFWVARQLCPNETTQAAIAPLPAIAPAQSENLLQRLSHAVSPRLELPFTLWGALLEQPDWRQRLAGAAAAPAVQLRQWFQDMVTDAWQTIDSLLGSQPNLAFQFRQSQTETEVRRVRPIELSTGETLLLVVALTAETDDRIGIRVQLFPQSSEAFLPAGLTLSLLTANGSAVQTVQAQPDNSSIQLKRFRCPVGTSFSIAVSIEAFRFVEEFIS